MVSLSSSSKRPSVAAGFFLAVLSFLVPPAAWAFHPTLRNIYTPRVKRSAQASTQDMTTASPEDIQWQLFQKHHTKGCWKGIWTTYDYIGDVQDETVAAVVLDSDDEVVEQSHQIVVGAKRSDCKTCFDDMEIKTIPVTSYSKNDMKRTRLASCALVNGPTLLRSTGVMATELVLNYGDGRVRVIFQHAPVWERGIEPGSVPPQGLKLFRAMVSREALRDTAPTAETEERDPPTKGNPIFYRPVPPFNWHKKWSGSSWTWGPNSGDRGWSIEELEEVDAWHGNAPVELWNLRLGGGIFVQAPRIVTDAETALCRLAWLPDDENLLRVEAGVTALQPIVLEDDMLAGFEPPSLVSLRCDVLRKIGDLEGEPQFAKASQGPAMEGMPIFGSSTSVEKSASTAAQTASETVTKPAAEKAASDHASKSDDSDPMQAVRNALKL